MCGVFLTSNLSTPQEKMQVLVTKRGQDVQHVLKTDRLLSAFGRLGFTEDYNQPNQPYFHPESQTYVWFTGEIYNFKELGRDLGFDPASEVELIARLYNKFGDEAYSKLAGMFSIYLYSQETQRISLIRDQFGTNPIYYLIKAEFLECGSDINYFRFNNTLRQNTSAWRRYFHSNSYYDSTQTFFENCFEVEPGTKVELCLRGISEPKITKWYDERTLLPNEEPEQESYPQGDYIRDIISTNISLMCRSPFKSAAFCSGGVDSTLISNLLAKENMPLSNLWHFTTGSDFDFSQIAKGLLPQELSKKLKVSYFDFDEMLDSLRLCIGEISAPVAGLNTLASKKAYSDMKRYGIKFVFSGEGADEIFGGYDHHLQSYLTNSVGSKNVIQSFGKYNFSNVLVEGSSALQGLSDIGSKKDTYSDFSASKRSRLQDLRGSKLRRSLNQANLLALNEGIEVRYPFLDQKIVKSCFSLDDDIIFSHGQSNVNKNFLIELFPEINLPKSSKQVIQTNQAKWIMTYNDWILDNVKSSGFKAGDVLDKKKVVDFVENFNLETIGIAYPLWQLTNYILADEAF